MSWFILLSFLAALFLSSLRPFVLNIDCFPWLFFLINSLSRHLHLTARRKRGGFQRNGVPRTTTKMSKQRCRYSGRPVVCKYIWVCARVLLLYRRYPAASLLLVSTPRTPTSPPLRSPVTRLSPCPCTVPSTWPRCRRNSVAWPLTVSVRAGKHGTKKQYSASGRLFRANRRSTSLLFL